MDNREQELDPRVPLLTRAGMVVLPGSVIGLADALFHGGMTPVALSGFGLALLAAQSPKLLKLAGDNERILLALSVRDDLRAKLDALTKNYFSTQIARLRAEQPDLFTPEAAPQEAFEQIEPLEMLEALADRTAVTQVTLEQVAPAPQTDLFAPTEAVARVVIERVTIDLICEHIERNGYGVYVGRSLTQDGNPAVPIAFYKQHIEIIGKSQRGKSSMAAALMDIITRTHNPEYVQLALLDMENQTSTLFAHLPHVMVWKGKKLHARTPEEVIEHLGIIVEIMKYRYTLPALERKNLPVLLVYVEEFLALKNQIKGEIGLLKGDELKAKREEKIREYAQLVLSINMIALRGLKARVQLLLCAQVDYADKDFREALAMFGIRFSFCVDPDAARAAGFTANELLAQNHEGDQFGEAVLEAGGRKDLLLAPDFPVEQRIIELEAKQASQWPTHRQQQAEQPKTPGTNDQVEAQKKVFSSHAGNDQADRRNARLSRLRGTAMQVNPSEIHQVEQEPKVRVLPSVAERKPTPTEEDAILAYNEIIDGGGLKVSRYNLRDALVAKGFECGESKARSLLERILELQTAQEAGRQVGR